MDLNRISLFVAVVEARSFSAAARALGVPKSSVSRGVAQLESDLGVRLLQRTTRALHLTDAGHAYFEQVSRALAAVGEATAAVSEMQGTPRGVVRISAPADMPNLPELLARFAARQPGIHVEAILTSRRVDLVDEGIDLAIRAGPLRDSSLIARRVGIDTMALYASPAYLKKHPAPRRVRDLAQHSCILFRAHDGKARWILTGPRGVESVEVTGPISGDYLQLLVGAALAGAGIASCVSRMCARDLAAGRLVRVLPHHSLGSGPLHVVYPSARFVPQRVVLLREFLVEELTKEFMV
jgi:DNA-binding transcriptional LysR family regulator